MTNEKRLSNLRIAILATDYFEYVELVEPKKAYEDEGAEVTIISPQSGSIQGVNHVEMAEKIKVDQTLDDADPEDFDALYLPGGAVNADSLRINSKAQQFVIDFEQKDKPIAAMCHGPWLLVSSNLVTGRTLTSWETIKDDIRNAGGRWIDFETVFDDNWITSRGPKDLPAFKEASILLFESCLVTAEEFLGDLEETE